MGTGRRKYLGPRKELALGLQAPKSTAAPHNVDQQSCRKKKRLINFYPSMDLFYYHCCSQNIYIIKHSNYTLMGKFTLYLPTKTNNINELKSRYNPRIFGF